MLRHSQYAGSFYPDNIEILSDAVADYLKTDIEKQPAKAIIVPHAGYIYSAATAAIAYSSVNMPSRVILLGPSHRPLNSRVVLSSAEAWEIPLGQLKINKDINSKILDYSKYAVIDDLMHSMEHSLEVQLPFLYCLNPEIEFSAVMVSDFNIEIINDLSAAISRTIKEEKEEVLLIASSDMSHYIKAESAMIQDNKAFEKIELLDAKALLETVEKYSISMCGAPAVSTLIAASLDLGANSAQRLAYTTSGDVTGDYDSVVAYVSYIIS